MMNGKLKLAAMCAIAATMFAGCEKSAETTLKSVADTRPRVKTCVVRTKKFAETAFVQGTVRAKTSAAVAARVPGVIDALLAKEGDAVEAGAALFDVDRVNLENAVRGMRRRSRRRRLLTGRRGPTSRGWSGSSRPAQ